MIILGLHGPAGIGKTTIARMLADKNKNYKIDHRLYQFRHIIIKRPIREVMYSLWGLRPDFDEPQSVKNKYHPDLGMPIRLGEIKVGNMLRKEFGDTILCKAALREIQLAYALGSSYGMGFVVESIRLKHEVDFFREKAPKLFPGAKVIMVDIQGQGKKLDPEAVKGKTEDGLPPETFDISIQNDFSLTPADLLDELLSKL